MCECSELVQYGSWAGAYDTEIACSVLVCVNVYRWVHVRENQYLCTVLTSQGFVFLCTSVQCEPPRASYSVLVLAPQGFLLLCTSVRCEPKRVLCGTSQALCFCVLNEPQELCAVRAYKGSVQCAPGLVILCTVRAPRALCGASLQRLYTVCDRACAYVYCTSPKSFVRCEPTKALHSVRQGLCFCVLYEPQELCAVRAYKGFMQCAGARPLRFAPSAYVLVGSNEQMSSCTRTCTYVLYEFTRYLCFCTRVCR